VEVRPLHDFSCPGLRRASLSRRRGGRTTCFCSSGGGGGIIVGPLRQLTSCPDLGVGGLAPKRKISGVPLDVFFGPPSRLTSTLWMVPLRGGSAHEPPESLGTCTLGTFREPNQHEWLEAVRRLVRCARAAFGTTDEAGTPHRTLSEFTSEKRLGECRPYAIIVQCESGQRRRQ